MKTISDILNKLGYTYEELSEEERKTLHGWSEVLNRNVLTVDGVREYIVSMRDAVEQELTEYSKDTIIQFWFIKIKIRKNQDKDLLLKARLRNYMLLEAFLSTPEKAKKAIDRAIAGLVSKK